MKKIGSLTLITSTLIALLLIPVLIIEGKFQGVYIFINVILIALVGVAYKVLDYMRSGEIVQAYLSALIGGVCIYFDPLQFSAYIFFTGAVVILIKYRLHLFRSIIVLSVIYFGAITTRMIFVSEPTDIMYVIIAVVFILYLIKIIMICAGNNVKEYIDKSQYEKEVQEKIRRDKRQIRNIEKRIEVLEYQKSEFQNGYKEALEIAKQLIEKCKGDEDADKN